LQEFDVEVDVLVIGAGGAGLAAAVAAHEAGARVAMVEKQARPSSNTALSTGSLPGAGTRYQKKVGIIDSADTLYGDLMGLSGPHDAVDLTRVLADLSAKLVEWMADVMKVRLDIITTTNTSPIRYHAYMRPHRARARTWLMTWSRQSFRWCCRTRCSNC